MDEGEDLSIDEFVDLLAESGYGDIAVAIRDINAEAEKLGDDAEELDLEAVTMPFHDEDFEMAFTFGLLFGAKLEQEYDLEPDESAGT